MFGSKSFSSAKTDEVLETCSVNEKLVLWSCRPYCSNANTVNTSCTIGFGVGGNRRVITGHDGIDAGSGFVEMGSQHDPLAEGNPGEPLTWSNSAPSSGSIRVNYSFGRFPITQS
jgi:hypothetical protein